MTTPIASGARRFGRFELQPYERRLLADGEPVAIGARAFDVLLTLADRPGQLVSKRALMELVWPGLVVQDNNLAAQVSTLRKVVGDAVIATIPGRGYRFVARSEPAAHGVQGALPDGPAVPVAAAAFRTNLPAELPTLLGRTSDLEAVGRLVDQHRLVTLVGAGGIGKSLLAQHLLQARRRAYAQGVCWVELATITDPAELPAAVATALGVEPEPGDPLATLVRVVGPRALLLALDNAEHLLDGVARLAKALHDAALGLRIIATSQAPLRLAAERVVRIGPLAVPSTALPVEEALGFGAVALFAERARAVDAAFTLDDSRVEAVIEICQALDGLPLAIEFAAARAPTLGVLPLLASMQDRLALLTANRNRAAPERQQTLRAAFEWSYGLLTPPERALFRRLGVVAGSAGLGLALGLGIGEGAGDGDTHADLDTQRWSALDTLDTLVQRSLVAVLDAADGEGEAGGDVGASRALGEPRYRLLDSARAFALECLDAVGERAAFQRRHALAMAAMLDEAYAELFAGRVGVDAWMRRLEPDLDNAREALKWARAAGEAELELRLAAATLRALPPSLYAERMALVATCTARLDTPDLPEALQYRAWIELSRVLGDAHRQRARDAAARACRLARGLDGSQPDRFALYHALARSAGAEAQGGDLSAARALLDEMTSLEDPAWPAQRLVWGAEARRWLANASGDTAAALDHQRRLVALDRERGANAATARTNLINVELAAGDPQSAARSGAALVQQLRATRDERALTFAQINLAAALLALDDAAQARPVAQEAWGRAPAFEIQHLAATYLALLAALEARPRAAAQLSGYAQHIFAERHQVIESNEARATERTQAIATAALGAAAFDHWRVVGSSLRDAEIGAIAFATADMS